MQTVFWLVLYGWKMLFDQKFTGSSFSLLIFIVLLLVLSTSSAGVRYHIVITSWIGWVRLKCFFTKSNLRYYHSYEGTREHGLTKELMPHKFNRLINMSEAVLFWFGCCKQGRTYQVYQQPPLSDYETKCLLCFFLDQLSYCGS